MNIILAGFNVDYETLRECASSSAENELLTPETVSAAYARISRNPLPVNELRRIARTEIDKARRSNRSIVFDMGHSSIAEHAVFNIDILDVSRLAVEEIEKFRLCSYTEKSQRYIRLEDDHLVPAEIKNAGLEKSFSDTINEQNAFYHRLYKELRSYVFDIHHDLAKDKMNHSMIEGWAKEDARYVVSMATQTQLGMTINARNLELMIRRTSAHPLAEVRKYGKCLFDATYHIAPSLIRYTKPTAFDTRTGEELSDSVAALLQKADQRTGKETSIRSGAPARLVRFTERGDDRVISMLLFTSSDLSAEECDRCVAGMTDNEKKKTVQTALRHMTVHDAPPRAFEEADFTFELIVSSSCFAQMKRHRMATILSQDYEPELGVTIPPSVMEIGMEAPFLDIIARSEETYREIHPLASETARYVLTNAHRKRIIVKTNARELYHIARLREDAHAQWDIRNMARSMSALAKKVMPLTMCLACGKDDFDATRANVYTTV